MAIKSKKPLLGGLIVLIVLAVGGYVYWDVVLNKVVTTEDARIEGDMIDVAPKVPGQITEVQIHEGEVVHKGQVLFRLDDQDLVAKVDAAKAAVRAAQSAVPVAEAGVKTAQAQLDKALHGPRPQQIKSAEAAVHQLESRLRLAQKEVNRIQKLVDAEVATPERLERVQSQFEVAQNGLKEAKEKLAMLTSGTRLEDIESARAQLELAKARVQSAQAQVDTAQAGLAQANLALDHSRVRAPFTGVIAKVWHQTGEQVSPASPVVTVVDPQTIRVGANIEETSLDEVSVGDKVDMEVDAFPGVTLHGQVDAIVNATKSQFSLMPSEGTSGAFIKVTQRVPLRIKLDKLPERSGKLLTPGLSVVASIHSDSAATPTKTARK